MGSNLDFTSALEIKLDIQALPMCERDRSNMSEGWIYKKICSRMDDSNRYDDRLNVRQRASEV
jgi:hypothetical protein